MLPDEPFPLNLFPSQVRTALLDEFAERWPGLREIEETPDARWLSTPGIGVAFLKRIRRLGQDDTSPSLPDDRCRAAPAAFNSSGGIKLI